MILGHSLPRDWAYSIANGAFITDPAALHDRMSAEAVQIEWSATDPQTLTSFVEISATRTTPFVPRVGALIGTDLPEGLRVELWGRRAADGSNSYNLGGNSQSQRLTRLPVGGIGCIWALADGLDPIIGYGVSLFNDAGGIVAIAPEAELLIGEIIVAPAIRMCQMLGQSERWVDPSAIRRSVAGQGVRAARTPYREVKIQGVPARNIAWVPGGWQDIQQALAGDPWTLLVSHESEPDTLMQRTSVFGMVSGLGIGIVTRAYQRPDEMTVLQVPA